jgi:hypothetical protein
VFVACKNKVGPYLCLQVRPKRFHEVQALLCDAVQHLAVHDDGAVHVVGCLGGRALRCSNSIAADDPVAPTAWYARSCMRHGTHVSSAVTTAVGTYT